MKTMKKRAIAFLTVLLMLISCIPAGSITVAKAAEDTVLKLHYNRPDNNYDGWDVWMWAAGMDGAGYAFAEENGEMVATLVVAPGVTSVGFIIRTQDWAKDVDADQFIDISEMVSGTVHIYVESGVAGYTKEYGDDVVTGVKLYSARYDGEKTIVAMFTGKIEEELDGYFAVAGPDGAVALEKVEAVSDTEYHLILKEEINPAKAYTVTCDGSEYNIVMPILFSMPDFEAEYTYNGNDLGATYTKDKTSFRVWAPTADLVFLNLYSGGTAGVSDLIEQIEMKPDVNGTWVAEKSGDLNGTYYT
ncbi:MAG: type I pullulanase, partial [Lachnospiraceae bacterium]|nr:type I pullulanase [Lachnospiraceae bacterium]